MVRVSHGMNGERRRIEGNPGENIHIYTRADGRERERERCGVRDATRAGERDDAFLFHRTVETRPLVMEMGWAVVVAVRARGKTKNEDEVNDIHAGYRILPSRARPRLPSFRPPPFFLSRRSPAHSASHFLRLRSLTDTLRNLSHFT